MVARRWRGIEPLSERDRALDLGLRSLYAAWRQSHGRLSAANLEAFRQRLTRKLSVETGILERLYDVDRGTTEQLVEHGFVEGLVPRSSTDTEPARLIQILKDHEGAVELLMDCVSGQRELTVGFIHELHSALTLHQETVTAYDQFGNRLEVPLRRGAYKEWPNNPSRTDGLIHEFCPPLQVAPEMERLLEMFAGYEDVDPALAAAWLHHRFTQIHPYQDGNGRVARALVTLVLLKAKLLPVVVDRDARVRYLNALESADDGDIGDLARFFAELEQHVIMQALSVETDGAGQAPRVTSEVIESVGARLRERKLQAEAGLAAVNETALRLRASAERVVRRALNELRSVVDVEGGAHFNFVSTVAVNVGGADRGNAHWYRQDVVRFAKESDKFVNFDQPHYFVKGSVSSGHERLIFVVSLHHVGRIPFGVMEATAFAQFVAYETSDDSDGEAAPEREVSPCSTVPFAFTYSTRVEDVEGEFEEWVDRALAPAILEWSYRL